MCRVRCKLFRSELWCCRERMSTSTTRSGASARKKTSSLNTASSRTRISAKTLQTTGPNESMIESIQLTAVVFVVVAGSASSWAVPPVSQTLFLIITRSHWSFVKPVFATSSSPYWLSSRLSLDCCLRAFLFIWLIRFSYSFCCTLVWLFIGSLTVAVFTVHWL